MTRADKDDGKYENEDKNSKNVLYISGNYLKVKNLKIKCGDYDFIQMECY